MNSESGFKTLGEATSRQVTGFTAASLLVSNVLGIGLFTTTGYLARDLGNPSSIITLWVLGAFFALAGALCYGELGAAFPVSGGEYIYLRNAYGPLLGFLSGWAFFIGFGAAIAAASIAFATYFLQIVPLFDFNNLGKKIIACALVWFFTVIHLAGVVFGGFVQKYLTILKIIAIFLLVSSALTIGKGNWNNFLIINEELVPSFSTTVYSFIFVTYAYTGWNVTAYIAGEIKDPEFTIPRILIWGTFFVCLISLTVNLVYFYALPVNILANPPVLPVAEKAFVALFGSNAGSFISLLLCLSIAGAVSAMIWIAPRMYHAIATIDGVFPTIFSGAQGKIPVRSTFIQSFWVSGLILSGAFEELVILSELLQITFTALTVGAVILLRWQNPEHRRPYHVPLYPYVPLFYIVISALIAICVIIERPLESMAAIGIVFVGIPLYFLGKSSFW